MGLRCRDPGLAEPVVEAGLGESGVVAGHECALVQFCAEVACGSVITSRGSRRSLRTRRMSSSRRNCCGPATSTMPLTGDPTEILPTALATSSAAMGWIRTGATRTVLPSVASEAILLSSNSKNCVARMIEYWIDDLLIRFSWAILARK